MVDKNEYHRLWARVHRYNMPIEGFPLAICPGCGVVFQPRNSRQIYHTKRCGVLYKRELSKIKTRKKREQRKKIFAPYQDGPVIRIPLTGRFMGKHAVIDNTPNNLHKIADHIFGCDHYGYPMTNINGKMVHLHQLVYGEIPHGKVIDHINRDKLDARLCNLRVVSRGENNYNQPKRRHNTTGYTGVYCDLHPRKNKPYYSRINKDNKTYNLGYFETLEQAIAARRKAEQDFYGIYTEEEKKK